MKHSIVFVAGQTKSGKTTALDNLFVRNSPRVISLDSLGEFPRRNPDAIRVFGFAELMDALKRCAAHSEWHIAAHLKYDENRELFAVLCPEIRSANTTSYAQLVGGLAVECSEASRLAPNNRTPDEIKNAFLSGRHFNVSLYMATQRAAEVDRCVTSQADVLMSFAQYENIDLDYWKKKLSPEIAAVIERLPKYHSVYYVPGSGCVQVLDARYQPVRSLNLRGGDLEDVPVARAS